MGPALFLLYVNYIPEQVECDISIYTSIKTIADSQRQQADLSSMPQVEFYRVDVHQSAVWNCVVNICYAL